MRFFDTHSFFNRGDYVVLYFDASTSGYGAFMECNGIAVKYLLGQFVQLDFDTLKVTNVNSQAQQACEALALLIMLREWFPFLVDYRCSVSVRGDNLAALSLLTKMQPKSPSLAIVAREIALVVAEGSYTPDFIQHVAGVANSVADSLSRRSESGPEWQLPAHLEHATETICSVRDAAWWKTRRVM